MEKQVFGEQIYAGLGKDNGTERESFNRQTLLGPSLSTYLVQTILSMVITPSSLPRIDPLSTFFRKLGRRSKTFPESFAFSVQNNSLATETFRSGKFCSPTTL